MDDFNKRLLPIYLILLVDVLGFTIVFPLLPFYAEHFGASLIQVGFLGTVYALCQLIAGPILGNLSDRLGRKQLLIFSQAGSLLSFLMIAFAPSYGLLCLARAIDGLSSGNVSVAYAHVADITSPSERARAFTIMSTVFGLGFIAGPALSSTLFQFGYQVPFLFASVLSLTSVVLTYRLLREPQEARPDRLPSGAHSPWETLSKLFNNPFTGQRMTQFALFAFSFSLYFFGLPLFAERHCDFAGHPFGPREIGFLFLLSGGVSLAVQSTLLQHTLKRYGTETIVSAGCVLAASGYTLLVLTNGLFSLVGSVMIIATANAVLRPNLTGLISRHSNPRQQGATMGALQSIYSLADLLAPLLAGWLIARGQMAFWGMSMSILILVGSALGRRKQAWRTLF